MITLNEFKTKYKKELDFLKEEGCLIDDWSNVYDHCLKEGQIAQIISNLLEFSKYDQEILVKAALLHDWYKRGEGEAVSKRGAKKYDIKAKESARLLKEFGYSEEIVELAQSIGHTSLRDILTTNNFIKRLMHYIDDITYGDELVALDIRIDRLEEAERYKELNEMGRKIFSGKTYFQVQREVGHMIEKEIANRINVRPNQVIPIIKKYLLSTFGT